MPALPLDEAGKYVAAAYVVFVGLILAYVAIMAAKLERMERELGELADIAEQHRTGAGSVGARDEVPVHAAGPAAPPEPEPAGTVGEAEDSGGRGV